VRWPPAKRDGQPEPTCQVNSDWLHFSEHCNLSNGSAPPVGFGKRVRK
jgi:hypothetical protein